MLEAKTDSSSKPTCFVLMPIADVPGYEVGHFGRVYEHLLKPAIIAAGYHPVRADDAVKTDYIVVGIIQRIVESDMVLCDYSARNANVLYELGIRHAFNKPVVLLKDRQTEKIFDIQGLRYTDYDESLRIDAVNRDQLKITNALKETANATDKEFNSIVRLAGIKTAEAPAVQTVTEDTSLILNAIAAVERRIEDVEKSTQLKLTHFVVGPESVTMSDGFTYHAGTELFQDGASVGAIVGFDQSGQSITLKLPGARPKRLYARSPHAAGLIDIPF